MSAFPRRLAVLVRFHILAALFIAAFSLGGAATATAQDISSAISVELSSSSAADDALSSASSSSEEAPDAVAVAPWDLALPIFLVTVGLVVGALIMYFLVLNRGRGPRAVLDADEASVYSATLTIAVTTSVFAVIGVLIILWMSIGLVAGAGSFFAVFGGNLMAGAAAAAFGGVAGFIFGIPRTREAADQLVAADGTGQPQKSKAALLANTNLERISDWLTTLLIGATLVQLQNIPGWLTDIAKVFKEGPKNEDLVPFVLVYFFGLAFLGIYLITRLYLTAALRRALGLLDGSDHDGAPDTAGARAKLENALAANDAAEQLGAIQYVDRTGIKPDHAGDLDFSLALARTLIALLKANAADDTSRRKEDLKTVVGVIATDPPTTAKLKADLAGGTTTGDAALDTELTTALG